MLNLLLYGLLAVLLAGGLFLVATRFLPAGEQIAPPLRDEQPWSLPDQRPLFAEDVDLIRLPVALRGYRFAETDLLLDRLSGELRLRDMEIERLRGLTPTVNAEVSPTVEADAPPAPSGPTSTWGGPLAPLTVDVTKQSDAPQPPPSDDDEAPVTETPIEPGTVKPTTEKPSTDDER